MDQREKHNTLFSHLLPTGRSKLQGLHKIGNESVHVELLQARQSPLSNIPFKPCFQDFAGDHILLRLCGRFRRTGINVRKVDLRAFIFGRHLRGTRRAGSLRVVNACASRPTLTAKTYSITT